jgi:CBS domain-containing protein
MRKTEPTGVVASATTRSIAVADFMSRQLVTLQESDDLAFAEKILRLGGIRHLPVVKSGVLVGLLTHRDILRSAAVRPPETTLASDVMTREPVAVRPTTSLVQAARTMLTHRFGCLPVCHEDGTIVGIITESDFVRFAADVVQDLRLVAEPAGSNA